MLQYILLYRLHILLNGRSLKSAFLLFLSRSRLQYVPRSFYYAFGFTNHVYDFIRAVRCGVYAPRRVARLGVGNRLRAGCRSIFPIDAVMQAKFANETSAPNRQKP